MLSRFFRRKPARPADPRELFVGEVEGFLRSEAGVTTVQRVPELFALDVTGPQGGPRRLFLDNVFAETRELSPEGRRAKLARHFSGLVVDVSEQSWDDARGMLVLALRGATYGIEALAQAPDAAIVRRPFVPFVDAVVAVDQPVTMDFVSKASLRRWGIDAEALFAAAEARLPLLANPKVELYDGTDGPLFEVASDDSYETSRLLVPGWLDGFRGEVEGNPVAIIPERATLMVGGDARPELVARLLDKAQREFSSSSRSISPCVYGLDPAGVVAPLLQGPTEELRAGLALASLQLASFEYGTQKRALDAAHAQAGTDIFVASYQVFRNRDTGVLRSLSVWTEGVVTWLPETECVALVQPGSDTHSRPRSMREVAFESIRDRLSPVPDAHPARWETTGAFPVA